MIYFNVLLISIMLQSAFMIGVIYIKVLFKNRTNFISFMTSKHVGIDASKIEIYLEQMFIYFLVFCTLFPVIFGIYASIPYIVTIVLVVKYINLNNLIAIKESFIWGIQLPYFPNGVVFEWEKKTVSSKIYRSINYLSLFSFMLIILEIISFFLARSIE